MPKSRKLIILLITLQIRVIWSSLTSSNLTFMKKYFLRNDAAATQMMILLLKVSTVNMWSYLKNNKNI